MKRFTFGPVLMLLAIVILVASAAVAEKAGETKQVNSNSSFAKDKAESQTQPQVTPITPEIDSQVEQDQAVKVIDNSQIQVLPENPVDHSKQSDVDKTAAGEQIVRQVLSHGGTTGTSANYITRGTLCQTATGSGSGTEYSMGHGFYAASGGGRCCDLDGDANDDAAINVGDAVWMINYVFKGGPPPPCEDEGDANNDCSLNVGDAVYLINYVFKGGPAPECGCAL
ncbi:MAG: hypothetical protein GY841_04780 [FCB group bacterium]|nr:hypothetical protein [FCB group bacterium]